MAIAADAQSAIDELSTTFPNTTVQVVEDGAGGAWVRVDPLPTGPTYLQRSTWVGFHVLYSTPTTDVYPHFVRSDLARADGLPLGLAFQPGAWGPRGEAAVQVSRANRMHNPNVDTPVIKLLKVLEWVQTR